MRRLEGGDERGAEVSLSTNSFCSAFVSAARQFRSHIFWSEVFFIACSCDIVRVGDAKIERSDGGLLPALAFQCPFVQTSFCLPLPLPDIALPLCSQYVAQFTARFPQPSFHSPPSTAYNRRATRPKTTKLDHQRWNIGSCKVCQLSSKKKVDPALSLSCPAPACLCCLTARDVRVAAVRAASSGAAVGAMPSILGDEFWGHFYRIDERHSFLRLREIVKEAGLKAALRADEERTEAAMAELHDHLLQAKTLLRRAGFGVPAAKDKHAVCVWDLSQVRSCNSTNLKLFLSQCEYAPRNVKVKFAPAAEGQTAAARVSKRRINEILHPTDPAPSSGAASSAAAAASSSSPQDLLAHLDRPLADAEVKAIDEALARHCYVEGLAFTALASEDLRDALGKLNSTWAKRSRLSEWTLRHDLLDSEYGRVSGQCVEKITAAFVVTLISDGWSGVQKKHVLNLLLATPEPLFLRNIDTKEDSVTGEYQFQIFAETIDAYGGMGKVPAVVTDNAKTMRKTWSLLRARYHGLFTYGCAPHGLQLHAQDLCKMPDLSKLVDKMSIINNWFSRHLQAGGRATLNRLQIATAGKTSAPPDPGTTRKWNGQVTSAEWHLANRQVLVSLVTEDAFDASSAAAKELRATVLDLLDEFWPLLPQFVELMTPLRLAIQSLQGNHATLSDVMGAWLRIHNTQTLLVDSATCLFSAATKASVKSIFRSRFSFLYHPAHLVAFALDPRYAKVCKAAPSVIRHWLRQLYGADAGDDVLVALVSEYGMFRASATDPQHQDIWAPSVTADPVRWWRSWGDEYPTLRPFALKLLSLPPSAAAAERNWSTQDMIISKRRNRLAAPRAEKLVYIYFNSRSLKPAGKPRLQPGITDEALLRWHSSLAVHATFQWPTEAQGKHMFAWDDTPPEMDYSGMHGDEMLDVDADSSDDDEYADADPSGFASVPFSVDEFQTPEDTLAVLPCPAKLPHDIEVGSRVARWFGHPFHEWHVGTVVEVNRRRRVSENVTARFVSPEEGETHGMFVADADTYGVDRLWVAVRPVPVRSPGHSPPLDSDEDE